MKSQALSGAPTSLGFFRLKAAKFLKIGKRAFAAI